MNSKDLKRKYIEFFKKHNHAEIDSAPLIPENDPSVLFTTAGMHPLVPFLMGEPHPKGKTVAGFQKCIRTGDIDEVGDATHLTFFEMLGNWSFGDYFKKEAIEMSFKFLTKELGIPVQKLAVTCFAGDSDAPKDEESYNAWISLGISQDRIAFLSKEDNWWGPAGETGPCGPDSEMFIWKEEGDAPAKFDPKDDTWVEIWNNVFMEYEKTKDGKYIPLKQKNVDTGMGVERVMMILDGQKTVYETNELKPIYEFIKEIVFLGGTELSEEQDLSLRIITDHMRASTFILGDERSTVPSNVDQGYILRRFIRRSIRHLYLLDTKKDVPDNIKRIADRIIGEYSADFPILKEKRDFIIEEFLKESNKFINTIEKGLRDIKKKMTGFAVADRKTNGGEFDYKHIETYLLEWQAKEKEVSIDAKWLFDLFQSEGMPPEMTTEEIKDAYKASIKDEDKVMAEFQSLYKHHQELSRAGAEKRFKGGLADDSDNTKKLHTATHMLNEALRKVLGDDVKQKGSNITSERLRFDFNFSRKLTAEEKAMIEELINSEISMNAAITKVKMPLADALKSGAQSEFGAKYPDEVWVYSIGNFSKEICMGPHCENTSSMGTFKIKKEESVAAGVRRIKAILV